MQTLTEAFQYELMELTRMAVALVCGAIVGMERERTQKGAGFRTHILICLGACVFALVGLRVNRDFPMSDPLRLVQGVLLGIGFISGGVIMMQGGNVRGLTTAAGLWLITAVGLALGLGYYMLGILTTIIMVIVLSLFRPLRRKIAEAGDGNGGGTANGHGTEKSKARKLADLAHDADADGQSEEDSQPLARNKQRLTGGG